MLIKYSIFITFIGITILVKVLTLGNTVFAGNNPIDLIYVSFFSHNEEDDKYWLELLNDRQKYLTYRADLIAKVKLLRKYGAILDWETEHITLKAMKKFEKRDLFKNTNGKNILQWMVEDMGVKVGPHGHLSQYNYADLAYLIEDMGVKPSSVIGGFELYRCGKTLGYLEQTNWKEGLEINSDGTIKGRKFPHYSWRPKILGQPGMMGHFFDEFSSGVWLPEEEGIFSKHQADARFIYIGQGYPHYGNTIVLPGNKGVLQYNNIDYIRELAEMIKTGRAPAGKIYTCSIHLTDSHIYTPIASLHKTLENLKDLVKSGLIIYQDYESVAETWRSKYREHPNKFGIENFWIYNELIFQTLKFCKNSPSAPYPGKVPGMMHLNPQVAPIQIPINK
jgi:hypothetical protein